MMYGRVLFRSLILLPVLAAISVLSPSFLLSGQSLRPFTVDDALRVRSVSIADASDDARWLAVTASTARSRMNTDHFRFGDPTYIGPSLVEVMVVDAETGTEYPLFDNAVQVGSLFWSPEGDRLAFLQLVGEEVRLVTWDRGSSRVRPVRLRPEREIAWGTPLEWLPDGTGIVLGVRAEGWAREARAAYEAMEVGPIVVQDSSEPFLSWDAVRNRANLAELALVDLSSGALRILGAEASYQDVRVGPDGTHLTYTTATPLQTSYERGKGTEYAYLELDLAEGSEPVEIMEKGEERIRASWAPDGSGFAWSDGGDVFFKMPEADSAVNLTEDYRQPLSESDSTKRSFSLEEWHPDSNGFLLRAQDGYYVMMEGEEPELVWPFPGDNREEWGESPRLDIVRWTEDGRYLFASRSDRDRWERGLVRYDLESREEEVLVLDSDLYRSWTVAEDGSRVVFRRSDGDRPDEIWTASGTFENPRALTDMNPWLGEVAVSESRLIKYLDVDGEELYGIIHLPPDYQEGTAYPLVAEIYETFFDNGYNYSAQTLAAQGWIVLQPSVDLEIGFPGEAWMKGVTTAINTLIDDGMVDGRRLGVHGTSYGGYATNLLITQTDRFAAAINISGKVNIISFLGDSEKITTRNYNAAEETQDRIGATLWEQPQKYWAHTAVLFADRIETPLLLLTGHGDWNVPDTNTREMYYALRRLGKEVVWVNYMRAGHGAGRAGTEEDYRDHWRRVIEWYRSHFEKALEGEEG
ncbi:MAG: prolyl oligopeptidase family serine peptidase [Gemmatimonadota bacterium]|jgi:dipeptidyl aminopeptidase/acylaminoacyl peptidase